MNVADSPSTMAGSDDLEVQARMLRALLHESDAAVAERDLLRLAFDGAPVPMLTYRSADRRIRLCNAECATRFGCSSGDAAAALWHDPTAFAALNQAVLMRGVVSGFRATLRTPSGIPHPVIIDARMRRRDGDEDVMLLMRDAHDPHAIATPESAVAAILQIVGRALDMPEVAGPAIRVLGNLRTAARGALEELHRNAIVPAPAPDLDETLARALAHQVAALGPPPPGDRAAGPGAQPPGGDGGRRAAASAGPADEPAAASPPLAPASPTLAPAAAPAEESARRATGTQGRRERAEVSGTGRILVVEDNDMLRDLLATQVTHLGYQATVAANGAEALQHCDAAGGQFDLVLLDMVMPVMDGRATIIEMHRRWPTLKVLILSGYSGIQEMDIAFRNGALGVISKPFTIADLSRRLAAVLSD